MHVGAARASRRVLRSLKASLAFSSSASFSFSRRLTTSLTPLRLAREHTKYTWSPFATRVTTLPQRAHRSTPAKMDAGAAFAFRPRAAGAWTRLQCGCHCHRALETVSLAPGVACTSAKGRNERSRRPLGLAGIAQAPQEARASPLLHAARCR